MREGTKAGGAKAQKIKFTTLGQELSETMTDSFLGSNTQVRVVSLAVGTNLKR
jgi:hypothetical protein